MAAVLRIRVNNALWMASFVADRASTAMIMIASHMLLLDALCVPRNST